MIDLRDSTHPGRRAQSHGLVRPGGACPYRPRLGSRFELPREIVGVAPSLNQFGHRTAEFRRIG